TEATRGEEPAVGPAPQLDALRLHVAAAPQVEPGAEHIAELARTLRPVMQRLAELQAIADAAAVVHREHDESPAREVLVQRVGVSIVVEVMPAEQHLAPRAAVEEDHRRE